MTGYAGAWNPGLITPKDYNEANSKVRHDEAPDARVPLLSVMLTFQSYSSEGLSRHLYRQSNISICIR